MGFSDVALNEASSEAPGSAPSLVYLASSQPARYS